MSTPLEQQTGIQVFAAVDLLILDEISNETLAGVESTLGAAAFDRLCHHGTLLQCPWPSYRRQGGAS